MNRNSGLVLVGVIAVLLLAATLWMAKHATEFSPRGEEHQARVVADMTSRTVRIPKRPTRILSLCTSATDAIVALGAGDRLVAIDEFSRIVSGAETSGRRGQGRGHLARKGCRVGRRSRLRLVVSGRRRSNARRPWRVPSCGFAAFGRMNCPVKSGSSASASAAPRPPNYRRSELASSSPATSRRNPAIASISRLYGPLKTVGRRTYIGDLLELAGGQNVAGDAAGACCCRRRD